MNYLLKNINKKKKTTAVTNTEVNVNKEEIISDKELDDLLEDL